MPRGYQLTLIISAAFLLLAAIALVVVIPYGIRASLPAYAQVKSVDFSIIDKTITLEAVSVQSPARCEYGKAMTAERVHLTLESWAPVVHKVNINGLAANIEFSEDGRLCLPEASTGHGNFQGYLAKETSIQVEDSSVILPAVDVALETVRAEIKFARNSQHYTYVLEVRANDNVTGTWQFDSSGRLVDWRLDQAQAVLQSTWANIGKLDRLANLRGLPYRFRRGRLKWSGQAKWQADRWRAKHNFWLSDFAIDREPSRLRLRDLSTLARMNVFEAMKNRRGVIHLPVFVRGKRGDNPLVKMRQAIETAIRDKVTRKVRKVRDTLLFWKKAG